MKHVLMFAMAVATAAASGASANGQSARATDPDYLYRKVEPKLSKNAQAHGRIVIDAHNPDKPITRGWHYMDAVWCGWSYNSGNPYFYVYDGSTSLYDHGDLLLAQALAVPCGQGNKLGYYVTGAPDNFTYDKTKSFTYP
ncbi:MAG: hypothetical protein JO056_04710 [Alphaproteobacteria bacterium]|nr:hypothetical protein [Alphaproteobacteria bacterium]